MGIAQRIHDTLESWQAEWKDRLAGWLADVTLKGASKVLDEIEDQTRDEATVPLDKLKDIPNLPPEFHTIIDRAHGKSMPQAVVVIIPYLVGIVLGLAMGAARPVANWGGYPIERFLHSYRLDPFQVITAWRRDPAKYAHLFDDLTDQGWSDERIEALKFFTLFYPSPADLVRWQAREVFEPKMVEKYGLRDELGELRREDFYKAGMTDEQIDNYWMAHWEHPELRTIIEMLRRTDFTEEDMRAWFRLVEIPPAWRDKLIQISYEVPTRVDVRRWWDMRTIDEARLREIYQWQGYHGKDLDDYVLWTKVYCAWPDLIARWSKGWITLDDVRAELTGYGMPAARVEELIQTKIKADQPERTTKERDITKTDLIKGVKKGVITRAEGVELLMDLGYDEDEAVYILEINIPMDEEEKAVTQRQLTKADILAGLKTEVITMSEARTKLLGLRYSPADVEFLLKIYEAQVKPPVEPKLKEASKADIVLGVKKGLITQEEGYMMLLEIDFSPEAAAFILTVKTEESPFSPINYGEFKDLTQKYRVAAGMEAKAMPEELKKAADEVVRITKEVESLKEAVAAEEKTLIPEEPLPAETTAKLKELRVTLRRGEAALAKAKRHYDSLLAQWRHKTTP